VKKQQTGMGIKSGKEETGEIHTIYQAAKVYLPRRFRRSTHILNVPASSYP